MSSQYKPPVAVHIIWHPSDSEIVDPILGAVSKYLSRDVDRPFSRSLNVPVFLYSSPSPSIAPSDFPQELATRNVLFVLTSVNTRGRPVWSDYVDNLPLNPGAMWAVPIALENKGLGHGMKGCLKDLNFVRAYEWPSVTMLQHAILAMSHEIYRYGFREIGEIGKSSSIKIFLSHAKRGNTGLLHAEAIKRFIENTNMSHFFDATEISPGFKFDKEITNHIKESTMVAIGSDAYSSRYWCQREILCAKEHCRPMIAVDCLEDYEDRIFPAGSNVPCVHVTQQSPLSESDILKVLTAALLETVRQCHAQKSLKSYQDMGWIGNDCALFSRPPEIRQLLAEKAKGIKQICYPEPPIYSEEADWHAQLGMETYTPLWNKSEELSLRGLRVGISISDVQDESFTENHLPKDQSKKLAQDLARHLLARAATLIYGGDLRNDGFTSFILDEAVALKSRLDPDGNQGPHDIHVENHLAWPIHKADIEMTAWRAKYDLIMESCEHDAPDDIAKDIDRDNYLAPSTPQNKYYWSRCLTEMRLNSIDSSHARICVGGKLSGYNGKMPGVLEEILIAIEKNKPIYLMGAFGGVVGEVCKVLRSEPYPETLTEAWQVSHNDGYVDLQEIAQSYGMHANYDQCKSSLTDIDISKLSKNAGLDEDAYLRLMETPFVDECVYTVMHGLKNLSIS